MKTTTLILIISSFACGCSFANVALNDTVLPLEARRHNATRAALGVRPLPVQVSADNLSVTSRPSVSSARATTRPGADDGCFVGIAISGGGSRSANFAASTMFQLQRIGLLQKTDAISSVSGGSMAAAYYCAQGEQWNPANVQKQFTHSFATDLITQHFLPWNLLVTTFSDYDRTDLLAGIFNRVLFTRPDGGTMTYADLRADRPVLLVNSTDIQSGRRFVFCNETFDDINSDLSRFPLGNAVAASSAVPGVLHHATLRDFSTTFAQYRHVIDGGVVDNLGVQTLLEHYDARASLDTGGTDPFPKGAIIIVIDATGHADRKMSDLPDVGLFQGLATAVGVSSTLLLNRASNATLADVTVKYSPGEIPIEKLRQQIAALERDGYVELTDRQGRPVRVVHFSLERTGSLTDVPFPTFRESVTTIGTYFNIKQDEAFRLDQAAALLMKQKFEPKLRKAMEQIDQKPPRTGEGVSN